MNETWYVWRVRWVEANGSGEVRLLVPTDSGERQFDLLFETADAANAWRDEEIRISEEDEAEAAFFRSWRLCRLVLTEITQGRD